MANALLDLRHRHAPGLGHLAAILVDDVLQILRHRARAVHHHVRVGQPLVDRPDHVHRQGVARRLAGELVGAVAGADGDRQRVDLGPGDEVLRLIGIGQQLLLGELALGTLPVLGLAHAGLERAQAPELTLDRDADAVRHARHLGADPQIVVVVGGCLAVGLERAVHHHAGEAVLDRREAGRGVVAVVKMQADRDLRVHLDQGLDHLLQHQITGIGARAAARLQDDRRAGPPCCGHDGERLLHVVDVEGRHAVAALGGVVEQLAQGDQGHGCSFGQAG